MLRFASSPTGDMHISNLRVALLNYIISKQLNEELLIRIDDINREKNIEGKDKEILETLALFNIDYARVVYQSENIKYHTQMAMKLLLDKKAFNCFCSDEALEKDKEKAEQEGKQYSYSGFCETISDETKFHCNAPFVVRLKKPNCPIKFHDLLLGDFSYEPCDVDSMIILKHDKSPTYNYASSIDDMLYDVSTILQEQEQLSNTPKQIHIRDSLGYDKTIKYAHISSIVSLEGNEVPSVKYLIDEGYLPIAIANYLLLLGYTTTPKEIFTIEEAIEWFDINQISKEAVKFDLNKLNAINKEYLHTMDELRLSKILGYADQDIGKLAKVYLENCNTIKEIKSKVDAIFNKKEDLEEYNNELSIIKEYLATAPFINHFEDLKNHILKNTSLTEEKLTIPLYHILTGEKTGPELDKIYPLIKNYLGEIIK